MPLDHLDHAAHAQRIATGVTKPVPNDDGQLGNGTLEDKSGQKQGMNDLHDALGTNSS
jgi:hypothetical protein